MKEEEEEKKELLFSHRAFIQHAIVPHIRRYRKAIHMQIPISLCTEHRLEKSNLASQTPNNVGEGASDNTDVTRVEKKNTSNEAGNCATEEAVNQKCLNSSAL